MKIHAYSNRVAAGAKVSKVINQLKSGGSGGGKVAILASNSSRSIEWSMLSDPAVEEGLCNTASIVRILNVQLIQSINEYRETIF